MAWVERAHCIWQSEVWLVCELWLPAAEIKNVQEAGKEEVGRSEGSQVLIGYTIV